MIADNEIAEGIASKLAPTLDYKRLASDCDFTVSTLESAYARSLQNGIRPNAVFVHPAEASQVLTVIKHFTGLEQGTIQMFLSLSMQLDEWCLAYVTPTGVQLAYGSPGA